MSLSDEGREQIKGFVVHTNKQKQSMCGTGVSLQALLPAQSSLRAVIEDKGRAGGNGPKSRKG